MLIRIEMPTYCQAQKCQKKDGISQQVESTIFTSSRIYTGTLLLFFIISSTKSFLLILNCYRYMNEIANDCSQTKNSNCQVNCKLNGTMLCTSKSIGDP
jgi:hypothetical protein